MELGPGSIIQFEILQRNARSGRRWPLGRQGQAVKVGDKFGPRIRRPRRLAAVCAVKGPRRTLGEQGSRAKGGGGQIFSRFPSWAWEADPEKTAYLVPKLQLGNQMMGRRRWVYLVPKLQLGSATVAVTSSAVCAIAPAG